MARADVVCLPNGAFAENCYILADPRSRAAVLVDPGEEAARFLARLEAGRYRLQAIWLTHAHLDHIQGVAAVKRATGVPIHLHPADRPLYDAAPEQGAWLGLPAAQPPPPDAELSDRAALAVGSCTFEVRHVPGHSAGSVAFVGDGLAVVGDAVFAGSIGRTDLPGGDTDTLLASIRDRILTLPDDTLIYPGHGPQTTVGREREGNPFLVGLARPAGATCMRCGQPIRSKAWGCKNPCPNCGFVYPEGDCSD